MPCPLQINNVTGQTDYCPAGYRLVYCADSPCTACPPIAVDNAVYVPSNVTTSCKIRCKAGYHTILKATGEVIPFALDQAFNPSLIECAECGLRALPCPLLSCQPGETIVQVAGITPRFRCLPCLSSYGMTCPPGTFADTCPGGIVPQLRCVLCTQPLPADGRFYIPYQPIDDMRHTQCPTACPTDTILYNNGTCLSCNLLYSPIQGAPYTSFFALWNAEPAPRWWPTAYDPPHLGVRPVNAQGKTLSETRAGRCWPCPAGTISPSDPLYSRGDLCSLSFSSSSSSSLQSSSSSSSSMSVGNNNNDGGYILVLSPPAVRRRLLLSIASTKCQPGAYPSHTWCSLCPANHWCPGQQQSPQRCPSFSASPVASWTKSQCQCIPPFFSQKGGECTMRSPPLLLLTTCPEGQVQTIQPNTGIPFCETCLAGTYPDGSGVCVEESAKPPATACPPDTVPSTAMCACGPGTQQITVDAPCTPCPRNTFSPHIGGSPCIPCPPGTFTGLTGATHLANCLPSSVYFTLPSS